MFLSVLHCFEKNFQEKFISSIMTTMATINDHLLSVYHLPSPSPFSKPYLQASFSLLNNFEKKKKVKVLV